LPFVDWPNGEDEKGYQGEEQSDEEFEPLFRLLPKLSFLPLSFHPLALP